jgi:ParB family chromosome partitioning protein
MEKTMETVTIYQKFGKAILEEIAVDRLHSGTYQPRDTFSEEALEQLSKTIKQLGILEPLIVRRSTKIDGHFEIVAGERRWRAAIRAGLEFVPCLITHYSDEQAAQVALIENTCREALDPISEALAMQRLVASFNYSHEELGVILGISRVQVTHTLRLLKLDARIQHWMKQGTLSQGHGKTLAGLPLDKQYWFAYEAAKKDWSVHTLEDAIKIANNKKDTAKTNKTTSKTANLEQGITEAFGHHIKISLNKNDSGYFRIPFHNMDEMRAILEKFGYHSGQETIAKDCDETLASPLHARDRSEALCEDA